ncbi:Protein TANC2 [Triticum urartu]|uniref:Protein TANC2 n=2 Tax=Triticum urartu TaxID=4572 RepID=M7ZTG3_TRIUA|nr:Protein TANC2 [Triticum urartu]
MNALHAAVGGQGKLAACRYLVETVRMDVNMWDSSPSKHSPPFFASNTAALLNQLYVPNLALPGGTGKKTPLEHAVDGNNLPALRYLLDHGADLNQEEDDGDTVLHHAARKGTPCSSIMIVTVSFPYTVFYLQGGRCEIVKLLLARGADVNGSSEHGTPLHLAAVKGHESTVEVLLEHHADVNKVVTSNLVTPLKAALLSASTPCVKLLVQAGANVNDANNCLARAASEGLTECVKCLLEAGADPNRPDECGRMPIELAAVYGTREDVELLFAVTSPISTVADWSIDGIINHAKLERMQLQDEDVLNTRKSDLKRKGDEAFEKQDYTKASEFYTQALKVDPSDGKMLASRSRCWLQLGDGQKALEDATRCKRRCPEWAEARLRRGQALMLLKDYEKACEELSGGVELDPENDEMDKLFWEAMELKKK